MRRLALFRAVDPEVFADLVRAGYLPTFPPGVELIAQGDPPDFLHVLVEGRVELHAEWRDDKATMASLRPVSTFILAAGVTDRPHLSLRARWRSRA